MLLASKQNEQDTSDEMEIGNFVCLPCVRLSTRVSTNFNACAQKVIAIHLHLK